MKEFEGRLALPAGRLTINSHNPTLRSEVLFMAESGSEGLPRPRETGKKGQTPQEAARLAWNHLNKGRRVPVDEARMIDELVARGVKPQVAPEGTPDAEAFKKGKRPGPGAMGSPPDVDEDELEEARYKEALERARIKNFLILTNADYREDQFNRLFSSTYAYPDKAFAEIFSPYYGHGREYDNFMNLIQQASVGQLDGLGFTREQQRIILAVKDELKEDFVRYQKERAVMGAIHDASRVLFYASVDANSYLDSIQQFDSLGGDVAFRTKGVNQMMNIIEGVLREEMTVNDGFLPPEAITGKVTMGEIKDAEGKVVKIVKKVEKGRVENEVKRRFGEWLKNQQVVIRTNDGKIGQILNAETMKEWEIEKTFFMARGMMLIDGRLVSLMAESTQPEGTAQYSSQFLQDILQSWSSFQHLSGKYGLTRRDLAALLYKDKKMKRVLGLSIWNPAEMKKIYEKYEKDPRSVLEDTVLGKSDEEKSINEKDNLYYIMRENPFRAGDVFTWITWRLNAGSEEGTGEAIESMIKDFMDRGRREMARRLGIDPDKDDSRLKEYENWIGTGIRFEKLRGDMALIPKDKKEEEKKAEAIKNGQKLLGRMVELQGYRFYSLSKRIIERVDKYLKMDNNQKRKVLENLAMVEAEFLKNREKLLDEGITFDKATLDDLDGEFWRVIKDESQRKEAQRFVNLMKNDFRDNSEKYYDEFIHKREYRHGFVLWTGDAPLDEFNFSRLAPTGGFARRARDNKYQAEASGKMMEFITNIKKMHKIEDVVNGLNEIHGIIARYDAGKADLAIMELAQGLIKFHAEVSSTNLPVYGILQKMFGKDISYAKMIHGKKAMAWAPSESYEFIQLLQQEKLITDEQAQELRKKVPAGKLDVFADLGVTLTQIILFWLMGYMAEKIYRGK